MARAVIIPILDDDPNDTLYYEIWYRIVGNANWTEETRTSPLPEQVSSSPAALYPVLILSPLADNEDYEYQIRRFNYNNEFSDWVSDTFNTNQ